jgi:putative tryptophan/tyrosine transport system substrate-binding protein
VNRREFITLLGGAATVALVLECDALAQGRHVRVGLLAPIPPMPALLRALREGLRERGYIEGQNLSIDIRWPVTQDPSIASELVQSNVDVILAWTTPAVIAARRVTSTIPIVMVGVADPIGLEFVASLARPGGNITGVSNMAADLSAKLMQLLIEIVPDMKRVGVLFNPNNPGVVTQMRGTEDAVRTLGLQFQVIEAQSPKEFESAFARLRGEEIKAVVLLADPSLVEHRERIAELAQKAGLATAFQRRESVEAGGLLSYGPNLTSQFRQTAFYIDRILRGAKPADLPVEQPTTFELVINLKVAKVLGLQVPPSLLARADEVIE